MRRFSYVALSTALLAMVAYLCSCVGGGGIIDPTDPILPALEQDEGTVDPESKIITMTKEGITVAVQHWSKTKLNRKYTTVDMRSLFYYQESWKQSFQSEAFHVTITNNTKTKAIVVFKESIMEDEREYEYVPTINFSDFKYKFMQKGLMDLRTKKGFEKAREILLTEVLGPKHEIPAGGTREGFISYTTPSRQATKIWVTVVVDKEPELATASYEKVSFRFSFTQDLILLQRQPPVKR